RAEAKSGIDVAGVFAVPAAAKAATTFALAVGNDDQRRLHACGKLALGLRVGTVDLLKYLHLCADALLPHIPAEQGGVDGLRLAAKAVTAVAYGCNMVAAFPQAVDTPFD